VSGIPYLNRRQPFSFRVIGLGLDEHSYVEGIAAFLKANFSQETRVGMYSSSPVGIDLFQRYQKSDAPPLNQLLLADPIHRVMTDNRYQSTRSEIFDLDVLILHTDIPQRASLKIAIRNTVRDLLIHSWGLSERTTVPEKLTIVLPAWPREELTMAEVDNLNPTFFITTSKAGSGRMGPTIRALAARAERPYVPLNLMNSQRYRSVMSERRLLREDRGVTWSNLRDPEESKMLFGCAQAANWLELVEVHKVPRISEIMQLPYMDFVLLMRDSRDMLVSQLWYMDQKNGYSFDDAQREKYLVDLIEYEMSYLTKEFVKAVNSDRIYCLRFEDVHTDPVSAYRSLLAWLGWRFEFTEADLLHDISLGSFSVQSDDLIKRGDRDRYIVTSTGTSVRRGVVGDWRNHFTTKSLEFFKKKCGTELIELGYEKDMKW
jgi:hypothetical protein